MLIRLAGSLDISPIAPRFAGGEPVRDGIRFTTDPVAECDGLLLRNAPTEEIRLRCPPENVWALIDEPWIPGTFEWMHHAFDGFARIYSHHPLAAPGYRRCHPALSWWAGHGRDFWLGLEVRAKAKPLSAVVSAKSRFPGHRARLRFFDGLGDLPLDRFGRGDRPLAVKADGLLPYRCSIAVENSVSPDYWTEKLSDCFLCYTLPIYHGCPNIEDYFPPEAMVAIDIADRAGSRDRILAAIEPAEWTRRREAIIQARRDYLERYELFAWFAREFAAAPATAGRAEIVIRPFTARDLPLGRQLAGRAAALSNLWASRLFRLGRRRLRSG